jgi:hypothetical protein
MFMKKANNINATFAKRALALKEILKDISK